MPKVKLNKKSKYEKKLDYLRGNLLGGLNQRYITVEDIASEFGVTTRTVTNWLRQPERCSFEVIIKLYLLAGIEVDAQIKEEE